MTTLSTVFRLACLWAASSAVMIVHAQLDLPGVDEKPGDPNALESVLQCGQDTNQLLLIPAVYDSLVSLRQLASIKLQTEDSCESKGDDAICTLDYGTIQTNYQSACENNGGVYDENDHQITCQTPDDPTIAGVVIYRFTNYPTCFSNTCQADDLERWIADEVDDFEIDVEQDTAWACDSDYQIEGDEAAPVSDSGGTSGGTCPNRVNDNPSMCGPLSDNLESQDCDCYTFCDGQLVECENFDSEGASDVFCTGELIMGCSNKIFAQYVTQQQQALSESSTHFSSATIMVASVVMALMVAV